MCLYMYIVFTVSQFHADVHSVYLVFLFDMTIQPESMRMSNKFWWDLKSSESKEPFKFHSPYSLLIYSISACSQHQYLLPWLFCFCIYHLTCRKKEQKKERKKRTVLQRKFKSQYIVRNWGTSNHRLFCVRKQNCWTSRHSIFLVQKRNFKSQDILCAESELPDLKSKLLYVSETAKLQVVLNLLYGSGIA